MQLFGVNAALGASPDPLPHQNMALSLPLPVAVHELAGLAPLLQPGNAVASRGPAAAQTGVALGVMRQVVLLHVFNVRALRDGKAGWAQPSVPLLESEWAGPAMAS